MNEELKLCGKPSNGDQERQKMMNIIPQEDKRRRSLDSLLKWKPKSTSSIISIAKIRSLASNKSNKVFMLPIEDLVVNASTQKNMTLGSSSNLNTQRDDGTMTSRITSRTNYSLESSKSSFMRRLSLRGGVVVAGPMAKATIDGLGLQQEELRFLKTTFDEIDKNDDGRIDKLEFLHELGEAEATADPNSFTNKVYQRIQLNWHDDNGINFDEFVRMSGTFCMFTHTDMTRFVFGCYNKGGDGIFGKQDFVDLSRAWTQSDGGPKTWLDVLKFDKTHKAYLDENDFIAMEAAYPQLLGFARRLQHKLQEISLGNAFYTNVMQRQEHVRTQEDRARMMSSSIMSSIKLLPEDTVPGVDSPSDTGLTSVAEQPDLTKRDNRNLLKLGYKLLTNSV